jgi:serine/threonine protein kinase
MLPTTINGYTLKHLLGEGGMANVYFAENRIGKCAAIKMLKPEFLAQAAIKQRFWQDAEIMAGLKHPNIREVYDFVETDTYMAIIMEYLEGEDLNEYLKGHGAIAESLVNKWFCTLLDAFQYAHDKGIVHRDVKPSNIFLTRQGEVKIIDFGIAKMNDGNHEWTLTNMKMGTPAYMSPEQILTPRNVDSRADVYSLGVLYYTLLAGKKPYNEDTTSDYLIQESVVKHSFPILGMSSDRANMLIAKATQKQVGNRYQTCREMLRALGSTANVKPPFQPPHIAEVTIIEIPEMVYAAPPPILAKPQITAPPPLPVRAKASPKPAVEHRPVPIAVSKPASESRLWAWLLGGLAVILLIVFMLQPSTPTTDPIVAANEVAAAATSGILTINADKMNVRSAPELNDENIIFQLPRGYSVEFSDSRKDDRDMQWYKVEYNGSKGWVSGKYATLQSPDALISLSNTPQGAERTISRYHQIVNNKDVAAILEMWSDYAVRYHGIKNPTKSQIVDAINASRCFYTSAENPTDFIAIYDNNLSITSCYYTLNFQCNPNGSSFDDTKLRTIRTRTDIDSNGKIVYSAPTKMSN